MKLRVIAIILLLSLLLFFGFRQIPTNKNMIMYSTEGGVEIETTNPQETQEQDVQGQGNIRPEKKRKAKWY